MLILQGKSRFARWDSYQCCGCFSNTVHIWATKKGYDFSFMGPFLSTSLLVLIVFTLIQIFIPLGKLGSTIFGGLGAILFSAFIIYDTDNLTSVWMAWSPHLSTPHLSVFLVVLITAHGSVLVVSHYLDHRIYLMRPTLNLTYRPMPRQ